MKSPLIFTGLMLVATSACSPSPPATAIPASTPTSASPAPLGTLVVEQSAIVGGFYTEGAFAYVEVSDLEGTELASVKDAEYGVAKELARVELPAGRYVIGTYVRPCEAACPVLDAPTDGCELAVDIVAGETLEVLAERWYGESGLWPIISIANHLPDGDPAPATAP